MRILSLGCALALLAIGCQDQTATPPTVSPGRPTPVAISSVVGGQSKVSSAGTQASGVKGPLAGQIKGKAFVPDNVRFEGGRLSFRKGKEFFADMEIAFDLPKVADGKIEGKEWKLGGKRFGDPAVNVAAKENKKDGFSKTDFVWGSDYKMTVKITKKTSKTVEGTIDLKVTKPANTFLTGSFIATVRKTASDPLEPDDAPYIHGEVVVKGDWKENSFAAGFIAKGADGKNYSNMAGTSFQPDGGGWVTCTTFEPQLTSLKGAGKPSTLEYRHTRVAPGDYLVYIRREKVLAAWKHVKVKPGDELKVDLTIDLANMGEVQVALPDEELKAKFQRPLRLEPVGLEIPGGAAHFVFDVADVKEGEKSVTVKGVPAGKYKVSIGKSNAEVEVKAGETAKVTLTHRGPKKT